MKSINKTESIIKLIKDVLLEDNATKESFNAILNIKTYNDLVVLIKNFTYYGLCFMIFQYNQQWSIKQILSMI